ncbi:MAG: DUF1819 family protein [Firmicutes bacterium]|nr:DUF1819 family protein [Bacillota bacterium]
MLQKDNKALKESSPYEAVMTREQFLFYEMRTTARLVNEGLDDDAVIDKILSENLFQYPTERSVRNIARACIRRLEALDDASLAEAVAYEPSDVAKQICLYAMMCRYRLVWDFMITVIGDKYKKLDTTFSKIDLNIFFMRLQEQDDWVATWSDSTIVKLKQVLTRILVETEYLDSTKSKKLNPVLICTKLENAIREKGLKIALPAFNCLA